MNDLGELIRRRIVAVVRHVRLEHLDMLLAALTAGGVSAVEFTFTGEDPIPAIRQARASHPEVISGAETIRTVAQLDAAIAAGSRFGVGVHGLGYVGDLLTVFPEAKLMVSGGVGVAEAQQYLDAGARIVCLGGALAGAAGSTPDPELITVRASAATRPARDTPLAGL